MKYVPCFDIINKKRFDKNSVISGPFGPVIFSKKNTKKGEHASRNPHDQPIPINKLHTPTFPSLLGTLRHYSARGHHVHLHVDFGRTCFHHQKSEVKNSSPAKCRKNSPKTYGENGHPSFDDRNPHKLPEN